MHIGIDARSIFSGGGGDRTYFRNLLLAMARLSPEDRWTLYADQEDPDRESLQVPNVQIAPPLTARIGGLWNVTALLPQLRRDKVDLLHAQYMLPPFGVTPCPMVVTIHDVTFRLFPQWFPRRANRVQNLLIPRSAQRASRVLTGSQSAADDLHRALHVPKTKITVTPYGLDDRFTTVPEARREEVRARYGLPPTYVLGVGLLRTRKNAVTVLRAVNQLIQAGQWPPGATLALTGQWSGAADAATLVQEMPSLDAQVKTLGFVPDADLPALYNGATVSVYPSLYEGFGFPALESMACGCPILAADTSSLPEVVGDAGRLLPTDDIAVWADALRTLLEDAPERARLSRLGREQAAQFTWERTARETLAVYREVTGQI